MNKEKIQATFMMILATFFYGTSFIVTKNVADVLSTNLLTAIRMLGAALVLTLLFPAKWKVFNKKAVRQGAVLGLFFAVGMILQSLGIKYTSAGRSAFLTAAYCIIVPFLVWAFFHTKPTSKDLLAALVCMVGIGLVALTETFTVETGDLYTLACSIAFGFYIIWNGVYARENDIVVMNIVMMTVSGIIPLFFFFAFEPMPAELGSGTLWSLIYLAVVCTAAPIMLQTSSQTKLSPSLVTIICGFEAIFAAIGSAVFLKESFTLRCLVGFLLIFLSTFVGLIETKHKAEA